MSKIETWVMKHKLIAIIFALIAFGLSFLWINTQVLTRSTAMRTVEDEIVNSQDSMVKDQPFFSSMRISYICYNMYYRGYIFQVNSTVGQTSMCDLIRPKQKPIRASEQDYNDLINANYLECVSVQKIDSNTTLFFYKLTSRGEQQALSKASVAQNLQMEPQISEPLENEEKP